MAQSWKSILFFSKTERRGLTVLSVLIIVVLFLPWLIGQFLPVEETSLAAFAERTRFYLEEETSEKAQIKYKPGSDTLKRAQRHKNGASGPLQPFDPNLASYQEWISMGFSSGMAERILKYRQAGGRFREKEALLKIYGMRREDYERIAPYLVIPADGLNKKDGRQAQDIQKLEINTTDSASLAALPGLGPYQAGRIIKYRNRLGGFVSREQLLEIRGLSKTSLDKLLSNTWIDAAQIRKIDINTCEFTVLLRHPYGGYEIAKALCVFRDKFGTIRTAEEIRQAEIIPDSSMRKLEPYLF